MELVSTKPVWERKNPKKHSKKLSSSQKADAKRQAKQHGRDQPSLVDNINAAKDTTSKKSKKS